MHGAGGGAPRGNRNALKHGAHSAETLAMKRQISALARMASETMAAIESLALKRKIRALTRMARETMAAME
jgi:uncharacterized protein YjcR